MRETFGNTLLGVGLFIFQETAPMIGISLSRGVIQLLFSTSLLLIFLWPVSELVSRFIGEPNLKKFLTWWLVLTPTVLTYCHWGFCQRFY